MSNTTKPNVLTPYFEHWGKKLKDDLVFPGDGSPIIPEGWPIINTPSEGESPAAPGTVDTVDPYKQLLDTYKAEHENTVADLEASRKAAAQRNYINYRRMVDRYLPEYLNSSGLYDVGSMSQPFLDAENNFISSQGAIDQNYEASARAAQNDYMERWRTVEAQRKADEEKAQEKADKDQLQKFNTLKDLLSDIATSGNKAALETFKDDYADMYNGLNDNYKSLLDVSLVSAKDASTYAETTAAADKLSSYLDYAAQSENYEFISNFETEYKDEIEALPDNIKGDLLGYLDVLRKDQVYLDYLEGEEEKARAEELQSKIINLADKGYSVVGGNDINTKDGKNFKISKDGKDYKVQIRQKEESADLKTAAANIENGQAFLYGGQLYVKTSGGIYSTEKLWRWSGDGYHSSDGERGYAGLIGKAILEMKGGALTDEEREFIINKVKEKHLDVYPDTSDEELLQLAIGSGVISVPSDGKNIGLSYAKTGAGARR